VLYGWTPEAFPSAVRGSACGLASFWGRLMSIVAPLIAEQASTFGQLYMAGAGILVCTVLTVFLPETRRSASL
jgi:nitrate/nitrite transporter NarK